MSGSGSTSSTRFNFSSNGIDFGKRNRADMEMASRTVMVSVGRGVTFKGQGVKERYQEDQGVTENDIVLEHESRQVFHLLGGDIFAVDENVATDFAGGYFSRLAR